MGQAKKGKKAKAATPKTDKLRVPKQIGDIKIPKHIRKSADALIDTAMEVARDTLVREVATAGVAAGVAAMVAAAAKARTPTPEPHPRSRSQTGPREAVVSNNNDGAAVDPDQLIGAIGVAASQALRNLIDRSRA